MIVSVFNACCSKSRSQLLVDQRSSAFIFNIAISPIAPGNTTKQETHDPIPRLFVPLDCPGRLQIPKRVITSS
jgi:hypothetical protein